MIRHTIIFFLLWALAYQIAKPVDEMATLGALLGFLIGIYWGIVCPFRKETPNDR